MKPPPPIPENGVAATLNAREVATAASTAFPPSLKIAAPASDA